MLKKRSLTQYKLTGHLLASVLAIASSASSADNIADIYELALKNDPTYLAAGANLKIGENQKDSSRAGLLPQISAGSSYALGGEKRITASGNTRTINNSSGAQRYNVGLDQAIFNLNSWFQFRSGSLISEQAQAQFAADQQNLIVRVTESYLNVLRANDALETSLSQEKAFKRQLEQVKERFAVGLVAITDVHEAQSSYDNSVAETILSRGNFAISFEALEVLTGRPHFEVSGLKDSLPINDPNPLDREEWVSFAIDNNFELKAALFGRDASIENSKAGKYNYAPTISLSGGYDYSRTPSATVTIINDQTFPRNKVNEYSGSINLTVPLYSGGGLIAERRTAAQQMILSQENYVLAKRTTVQNTRSAYFSVRTTAAQVKARKQAVVSAQSALESTQAGYEVGTRNIVDVLLSQSTLFESQLAYYNSRYAYIFSMMGLQQQAGQLSPKEIFALNDWLETEPNILKEYK